MKSPLITRVLTTSAFVLGAFALAVAAQTATDWTPPTAPPPGGNVPAPINVGDDAQVKLGSLILQNGLWVDGNLVITNGAGPGKVLTSDVTGLATWKMVEEVVEESDPEATYDIEFINSYSTGAGGAGMGYVDVYGFCRINIINGETICRKNQWGWNYSNPGTLFTASTPSKYSLSCVPSGTYSSVKYFNCCRIDAVTGVLQCKSFSWNSNNNLVETEGSPVLGTPTF